MNDDLAPLTEDELAELGGWTVDPSTPLREARMVNRLLHEREIGRSLLTKVFKKGMAAFSDLLPAESALTEELLASIRTGEG